MRRMTWVWAVVAMIAASAVSQAAEWNPVRREPLRIGPEASRIIVGFKATAANATTTTVRPRLQAQAVRIVEARTTRSDVLALTQRTGVAVARSRQITPDMHVLYLPRRLYGGDVLSTLAKLRADPAVAFVQVDRRRYALAATTPNDPLFPTTATAVCTATNGGCTPNQSYANGQWFLRAPPTTATSADNDLAAVDAVDAWTITTGSTGVVIADVDTGVLFDHPDLGRAGLGGRLLPGYDFVGQDFDPVNGTALGTYLVANDGDGWDPDPSDPGDWVSSTDFAVKDSQGNDLFPSSTCGQPGATSGSYLPVDSSWHGTRVMGVLGAQTNNGVGIAGMTWGPWLLPVRALGKCGGYDSDILAGIEWAAGLTVTDAAGNAIAPNPYPASIINLSLGGGTSSGCTDTLTGTNTCCPPAYINQLQKVTGMGVLIVAAAGNGGNPGQTAPVDAPAVCSAVVPGVVAVGGLRNVGTKVGYSSFGSEVTLSAPAGNCVDTSGVNCWRSLDTLTNQGLQGPGANAYTDETAANSNLGTSFSTPIVAGIAALMRSVNANLTPAELSARLASSATPFPANTTGLPVCPSNDATTGECACPPSGQCGSGMANALAAVTAAERPIAAVAIGSGGALDASVSAPSCGRTIMGYAWAAGTGVTVSSTSGPTVTASGTGTLTLTVTDSSGATDVATITLVGGVATTTAPSSAGTATSACPSALAVNVAAPTVAVAFSPSSVGENAVSTLTITFSNSNPFALTQAAIDYTLPANLTIASSPQTTTSCTGGQISATYTSTNIAILGAVIPAKGGCNVVIPVESATAGTYTVSIAANALSTAPAGGNTATASGNLTVNAPSHGGGAFSWPDLLIGAGLVVLIRPRRLRGRGR